MTRESYFDKLRAAAIKLGRYFRFSDVVWENSDLVMCRGIRYFPSKYILGFDRKGNAVHTVELHDLKNESVTIARLEDVEVIGQ